MKLPNPNIGRRGGSDKPILHGGGAHGININLAMLSPMLHPSLSVIDGFEGMEGNGPIYGKNEGPPAATATGSIKGLDNAAWIGYFYVP